MILGMLLTHACDLSRPVYYERPSVSGTCKREVVKNFLDETKTINIGTCNVHTLYTEGKLQILLWSFKQLSIKIVGISETLE